MTYSPFLVLSLPRSRSAWLSRFLSYREWTTSHEHLRYCRSLDDVKTWFSLEKVGSVETTGAPFWRLVEKFAPETKVVVVRRPVEEVVDSLRRAGLSAETRDVRAAMLRLDRKLEQAEGRLENVRSYSFSSLGEEEICKEIFEWVLPYSHDRMWWGQLHSTNIQIDFPALIRYVSAYLPQINRLEAQARQMMFRDLSFRPADMAGVEIREESYTSWVHDCQPLFRQHCLEVGESPDNWQKKNLRMMEKLYNLGAMQFMVARSNGRAFGYLLTMLSPSLEAENRTISQHTAFYAGAELPGLGLKLQRAANAALREKGVYEVFMRAGIRGSGDRVESLYRRLGAQDFGKMFRLELGEGN